MPKFIDHHKLVKMSPEMMQKVAAMMKSGQADQNGVKPINAFMSKDEEWCLSEAPNADAVRKSHEAMGMKIGKGDVKEVTSVL